ncbi:ell-associated factor 1 [Moniliophthora roreri MCA 2997]|uniref:Ell-associated factor 1 n=1 Tax=Moniliophthora roreri (strain MCA 2997) TaxID=1381753 RepID=V2XHD4_MONRO|nr:ell-associated factor 1 [Moniliophthora roreri MCA 2997]KAI3604763.1 ell-associated factor 1 [Moniliophthora roreri]
MASTSQWTPAPGRHKVNIGSSLGRALKARKNGGPSQKRSNLPDRDFYSLRYNFKPSSIDSSKSGSIQVKKNKDATHNSIIVEHPVSQTNDVHVYKGREEPAKEWACVLIFDEETGGYTLEKIESFVALEHVEKRAASVSEPSPAPTPSTNRPTTPERENDDLTEMLLNDLTSPQPTPKTNSNPDSEEDIPLTSRVPSRPSQHPPKAPVRSRPQPAPASKSAAPASVQPSKKGRRPEPSGGEETRNPPSKRSRPSPPPQPQPPAPVRTRRPPPKKPSPPPPRQPAALELPGTSSSFIPPAPPSHNVPSPQPPPPEPEPASTVASDSEDDDMVEVSAQPEAEAEPVPDQLSHKIVMIEETGEEHYNDNENEGGEEIDIGELETLMAQHLGEDGQDDGQDYGQDYGHDYGQEDADEGLFPDSPAPEQEIPIPVPMTGGGPISLNQFAGGGAEYDDYSSSEDSDEDDD